MTILKLSFKNLLRKRSRSTAVLLVSAAACGLIFSATAVNRSVLNTIEKDIAMLGADIMVVPAGYEDTGRRILLAGEPSTFYMNAAGLGRIRQISGVEKASPQLFVASAVLDCCSMPTVLLVGYDPQTDFTMTPWIRIVEATGHIPYDPVTIGINTLYASEGPTMMFYGKTFRIGSSLHATGIPFLEYSIFMSMDAARDMIRTSKIKSRQPINVAPDQISSVLVKVRKGSSIEGVAAAIEAAVPDSKAVATKSMITSVRTQLERTLWGVVAAGLAIWLMLVVLTGLIFSMTVNERQRELAVLRAMGAARGQIIRLIATEAALLAGTGACAGVGMSVIILTTFKHLISTTVAGIPFALQFSPAVAALAMGCIAIVLFTGTGAALLPALKSCRRAPYESMRPST